MAAVTASPALKRLDLRDPNALFETHGAEEIRGLERQVRAEIEHKKEELRQMVGERYRDLIEAADTIGQMRRCAEGLVDAVRATDQYCARLRQAGSAAPRLPRAPQVSPGPEPATSRRPAARRTPPLTFRRRSPPLTLVRAPGRRRQPAGLAQDAGPLPKSQPPLAPGAFPDFRTIPSPPSGSRRSPSLLTENARGLSTIKLLLEIPEKIWSSMETSQHLQATQLYLLCCHLHSLLQLDSSSSRYSPILSRFPILIRQVAAASHFRSTILHESKMLLKCQNVSDQAVAEALCSIMLLEESSPRQALTDFLMARKATIQKLLNQPHHGAGIKAQICSLVELLATTLNQAHALFYTLPEGVLPDPSLPCGLLFSTLETITSQHPTGKGIGVLQGEMRLCSWFRHLPASIMEFQPELRTLAHPISQEYLKDTLQKWIDMCNEDIKNGITNLLMYVKSMKGLAGIRDAIWDLLTNESASHGWEVVCRRLLEKPLLFWEDLMQQLFLDRLQTLTREGFESISSSSKELLVSALQELEASNSTSNKHVHFEQNMSLFLWSESPSDLPPDAAWVSVANRAQFANSGLSMKAQAVSPCVQSFCSALDSKLKVKLDDLLAYLPSSDTPLPKDPSPMHQAKNSAFDRYSDAGTVQDMLRTQSVACIKYVVGCIQAELQTIEEVTRDQKDVLHGTKLHAVLFMARLCQSLGELCPHLKQCIVGKCGGSEKPAREARTLKKQGKGKAQEVLPAQAQWQEVKEVLLQQSVMAYRVWSSALVKFLICGFTQPLLLSDAGSILATATNWDELEIQEETESGSSVTSKIRLPTQPSWYVQSFLFSLCQEVNRVGGHALPKVTLQEMLKNCMGQVIAAYEQLTEEQQKEGTFPMTQNRALQLLYDLRYLNIVLTSKGEEVKSGRSKPDSRIEKVTERLEALIDPFDLDVFTPHLSSNLNRLVQRTSVLFGLVTGTENQFASRSSTFNSQEPHNILPLASSQIRFGLLPLSMASTRKAKATSRGVETQAQFFPSTLTTHSTTPVTTGAQFSASSGASAPGTRGRKGMPSPQNKLSIERRRRSLAPPRLPAPPAPSRRCSAEGRPGKRVPSLTWGGGARSWQLVKASDAAPPRADSEQTELGADDRHAHPRGPGLWPPRGWRLRAQSTPRADPYHRDFRRLLRAPPCRRRRGTVFPRLRSGGAQAALAHSPAHRKRRGRRGKGERALPGPLPLLGVRSIRLLKSESGQAVKSQAGFG
ncbi:component of oligomeric golgi complex 1 [Cricetulus griseus]